MTEVTGVRLEKFMKRKINPEELYLPENDLCFEQPYDHEAFESYQAYLSYIEGASW